MLVIGLIDALEFMTWKPNYDKYKNGQLEEKPLDAKTLFASFVFGIVITVIFSGKRLILLHHFFH